MKFELNLKLKFFVLAALIFFLVSVAFSTLGFFIVGWLSSLLFGSLTGLGQLIYGLFGMTGTILGLLIGALVALVINLKIGKKWMKDFGWSEGEQKAERIRLIFLSFLFFLVMLWELVVLITEL
jgi:hypothetical protein